MLDSPNPNVRAERDATAHAQMLRVEIRALIDDGTYSMKEIATRADVGHSTLAAWNNETYQGRVDNINEKLQRWLDARKELERQRKRVQEPGFLDLPSARNFLDVFAYAQGSPEMGMVTGGAGVGKTKAANEYRKRSTNVWIMTADASMRSPTAILRELSDLVEAPERRGARMLNSILRTVTGTGGLLIVDEAQNLTTEAIDLLRTVYDRGGIGVVFMGNEPLRMRIEGMGRQASHAMIYSRIGMRRTRDKPVLKDIYMTLDAWGIEDKAVRQSCRFIASQPGALRSMNKTLAYAHMLAAGNERDVVEHADLEQAWRALTNGSGLPAVERLA